MATITASAVKDLRAATNISMMECKRALEEAGGDHDTAVKLLRERGVAIAGKKASRATNEGLVASAVDGDVAALVEVNCETDFVARNDSFQSFVAGVAERATQTDDALADSMGDEFAAKITETGENLVMRRNVRFVPQGTAKVGSYVHLGGKVGVLVEVTCTNDATTGQEAFGELVKDLTLHIAALNPGYLNPDDVPADKVAEEREIFAKQVEGKPEQIVDKIVDGKMRKFYETNCFVKQGFVKDPDVTIEQLVETVGKDLGDTLTVSRFARYELGA